jgi:hypothetical protein
MSSLTHPKIFSPPKKLFLISFKKSKMKVSGGFWNQHDHRCTEVSGDFLSHGT